MKHCLPSIHYIWLLLLAIALPACKKDFLTTIPNSFLQVPVTLEDYQAILDDEKLFCQTPSSGVESGNEFYFLPGIELKIPSSTWNLYRWMQQINLLEDSALDWSIPYQQVFYTNQVLEGLKKVDSTSVQAPPHHAVSGMAYFCRAYAFYNLAQLYTIPFDSATMHEQRGIPLPLSAVVSTHQVRTTVAATYDQILNDLQKAVWLLPDTISSVYRNRPSKPAAWAMLARVLLGMRRYTEAENAANHCLQLYNKLMNYDTVKMTGASNPFSMYNAETLYQSRLQDKNSVTYAFQQLAGFVDTVLYKSYEAGDLRASLYYRVLPWGRIMKANYYGDNRSLFTGLATDEVYLIRAECRARLGNTITAMQDLNTLLQNRYTPAMFVARQSSSAQEALTLILKEREKELVLRGQRWTDLRRLNMETGRAVELTRSINNEIYVLPPNDKRYTLPIPLVVIRLNNMEQNPR